VPTLGPHLTVLYLLVWQQILYETETEEERERGGGRGGEGQMEREGQILRVQGGLALN